MNTPCALMCFLLVPVSVLAGSHNLTMLATYIRGERAFSALVMLDDITVAYYNSETKIYAARGNNTNEDDVIDPNDLSTISSNVLVHFNGRSNHLRPVNNTESHVVYQVMGLCEQSDNKLGQMISKTAYRGSTIDELCFFDGKFTYQVFSNYTAQEIRPDLELSKVRLEKLYYPVCVKTLKNYLEKREVQVNRKVKPQVRLSHKVFSNSGGFHVRCLATGFYPHHINLTLLREGQPVADREITGGDLLPNGDGTYQMRKSLEISAADKHEYTCSATHLSLNNKLDVTLEFDHGEPFKSVIPSVLTVLTLMLVFGTAATITAWKRRRAGSHSLQLLITYIKGETPFPEFSVTFMLDDLTVGHYNSETKRYIPRDNTTNEDEIVSYIFNAMRYDLQPFHVGRLTFKNYTEGPQLYQVMSHCELWDNDKPGQMISKFAFSGSTTDEMRFYDNKFTYESPKEMATLSLEMFKWRHETINYPSCIATLRNYLKKRQTQVKKKVKPRVRLIQKANSDSGWFRLSCLATGFYPRHINLTLFRDGQPVADHEITGGDLLPNGDGTYQMRKSLEISAADKHKYTCSATHLSLDNRMTVDLEYDHGEPFKSVIPLFLTILALVLVFGAAVIIWKKCYANSSN